MHAILFKMYLLDNSAFNQENIIYQIKSLLQYKKSLTRTTVHCLLLLPKRDMLTDFLLLYYSYIGHEIQFSVSWYAGEATITR